MSSYISSILHGKSQATGIASWEIRFHPVKEIRKIDVIIRDQAKAIFKHLCYLVQLVARKIEIAFINNPKLYPKAPIIKGNPKRSYDLSKMAWKERTEANPSEGLYLCVHGLRGNPIQWKDYTTKLSKGKPNCDVVAPYVPYRGNCRLELAAEPILEIVKEYIKDNPGKPIHIVGTSNGGRIAAYIETHLEARQMNGCSLHIASIAGVHSGTTQADILLRMEKLWRSGLVLDPELAEEFRFNGPFARNLDQSLKDKQSEWKKHGVQVTHRYYASKEDGQVTPTTGALPLLDNENTSYQIREGESHCTIVNKVCNDVLKHFENPYFPFQKNVLIDPL